MKTEFEVKILDIDIESLKAKLQKLGFGDSKQISFKRYVFDGSKPGLWLRLRTDGKTTTLTVKNFQKDSIDGMGEIEVTVSDFETMYKLLTSLGLKAENYQENRRTLFANGEVEISIDEWPLIPPYLEIEAKNKELVEKYIDLLDLKSAMQTSKPTSYVYELNGLDINSYKHLSFK